jgi:hypothetical protein
MFITIQSRIISCPVCYHVQIDITQLSDWSVNKTLLKWSNQEERGDTDIHHV